MKAESEQILTGVFLALSGAGFAPANDALFALARSLGAVFSTSDGKALFHRIRSRSGPGSVLDRSSQVLGNAGSISVSGDAGPGSVLDRSSEKCDVVASNVRAPADHKGFGLRESWSSGTTVPSLHDERSQQLTLGGVEILAKRRRRPAVESTPLQLEAWAIRDAIGELVRPSLRGMTLAAWKGANGKSALDLARAGENAQTVVGFWRSEFERTGVPIVMLSHLQRRLATASREPADDGAIFDDEIYDERLEAVRARADARRAAEAST
jgi:hypothetical protein